MTTAADLSDIDLFDPALHADIDPHPIWQLLRERAPVHAQTLPDGRRFWSITRHADVCQVLRDHRRFTSERGTLLCALGLGDPASGKMMAVTDPPRHHATREPLNHALSSKALAARMGEIREAVRGTLAPAFGGGEWDVAAAMAGLPMAFTGTLMGLPEQDWPQLVRLTTAAIAPEDPGFAMGDPAATLAAAHQALFTYFHEHVRSRGENRDDLIGTLLRVTIDGRPLRLDEIVYNCYSLLLGANVTTPHVVSSTVLAFAADPAAYRRLTENPSLRDSAVEEALRWASPASHFMRYATQDTVIAGTHIPAGEAVAVWIGSANRDAAVFTQPETFDIARHPNRHIAFGFGPHFCVGAPLARIALRLLFDELCRLVEDFEVTGPVRRLRSNFAAGFTHLPVRTRLRSG